MSNQDPMNLFYNSTAIMLLIKPNKEGNHLIVDANQAAIDFYGYPYEALIKMHIGEINLTSNEIRKKNMDDALKKAGSSFQFKHQLANKEIRDVKVYASPLILDGKKRIFVIVHDISEQIEAIQKSKDQQEYAQALFNLSPDGIFLMDDKGVIVDGNKKAELIIGQKKETLVGQNLFETKILTTEGKKLALSKIKAMLEGDYIDSLEYIINQDDGKQLNIEAKSHPINLHGKAFFIGTIRDITDRSQNKLKLKESEEKFRYLADFTFEWEHWISPKGKYIYNSPSCELTTGYPVSAFEKNPHLLTDITHADYKDAVHKHFTEELAHTVRHKMNFKILKKNGEEVWIEHSCQPIFDTKGEYLGKRGVNRNITQEIKAKKALEESNQRFKNLSQLTFEGILIHKDGIIQDTNLAFKKLSGYSREEIINKSLFDLIQTKELKESVQKNAKKKHPKSFETIFRRKDGAIIDIEVEVRDYTLDGETMQAAAIRDITEKKKTQKTLNFLSKALQNSHEVVFTTDKDGVFNYINLEFTRLYGFSKEEVIGKETPRLLKSGQITDVEYSAFWEKLLLKESLNSTYVNKTKSGKLIDIEATADPILDENGTIIGFLALQHDITERKKRELRQTVISSIANKVIQDIEFEELLKFIQTEINKLMDARNFYFAVYDDNSKTISSPYFSDEFDTVPSFPSIGSLTGYLIEQKKSLLFDQKAINQLIKSNTIIKRGTLASQWLGVPLIINDKVKGAFIVQNYTNKNTYTAEDQKVLELIASQISMVMERKDNEVNLRTALVKAQESDRLKSTFLATMSHELRTPLNAIIGFSDLVEEERPKEEIINFCRIINKSGNHLLGIVNEIFDFTLIETGEIKLSYGEYPIETILKNVFLIIQKEQITLNKQDVNLSYHIPEKHKNLILKTDEQRLQQVLLNLLKNAMKFTDSGSINYGFRIITEAKSPSIQFYVEDTGIGIAEEKQEIIFDVFRQADDSHTRKHDGVGLGLSISRKIISLMGGNIWVKSEMDAGTTFYFDLPCSLNFIEPESDDLSVSSVKSTDYSTCTILIAEDEETNYSLLEYMLSPLKVKILWAKDGQEVLDLFKQNPNIDLILMDIRMPKLNGLEAAEKIKESNPTLPIIAQTAYAISGDKELALKAGCDDYIAKPIKKSELLELINKYLS